MRFRALAAALAFLAIGCHDDPPPFGPVCTILVAHGPSGITGERNISVWATVGGLSSNSGTAHVKLDAALYNNDHALPETGLWNDDVDLPWQSSVHPFDPVMATRIRIACEINVDGNQYAGGLDVEISNQFGVERGQMLTRLKSVHSPWTPFQPALGGLLGGKPRVTFGQASAQGMVSICFSNYEVVRGGLDDGTVTSLRAFWVTNPPSTMCLAGTGSFLVNMINKKVSALPYYGPPAIDPPCTSTYSVSANPDGYVVVIMEERNGSTTTHWYTWTDKIHPTPNDYVEPNFWDEGGHECPHW